jgi:predicted ATP-grasp superfamily ATP-dependent carboligase
VAPLNRTVTVFDVDLPPGVAFVRSLGRAGAPVRVCTADRGAAGCYSRYASRVDECPPVRRTDELVAWLADGIASGEVDLVAPTSDYVSFCVSAAVEKVGVDAATVGHPDPDAVRTCLFKSRFHQALDRVGFPSPQTRTPTSLAEALAMAEEITYPVVLKPRSHAGIGLRRGVVVRTEQELRATFRRFPVAAGQESVLTEDPDVALPLLQHYHELGTIDVVSVSGYLGRDGVVQALTHSRKVSQSPRRLGVGTMFEPLADDLPYSRAAVDAVTAVLGTGVFELEVLVDRASGRYGALDLNPRGFGQISLDIALGHDLPVLWYNDVTGAALPSARARRRTPRFWHDAFGSYVGFAVRFLRGPRRGSIAEHAWGRLAAPSVGAMHEWSDPVPGFRFGLGHLRHPRAFVRPFLVDTEVAATAGSDPLAEPS